MTPNNKYKPEKEISEQEFFDLMNKNPLSKQVRANMDWFNMQSHQVREKIIKGIKEKLNGLRTNTAPRNG